MLAVVLLVFGVVQLANLFRRSDNSSSITQTADLLDLPDYAAADSRVVLTQQGEIIAREDYREIKISISPNRRTVEIISGYNGRVIDRRSLANDRAAYAVFLRAINQFGFDESKGNDLGDDERGICPGGNRTVTELLNDGEPIFRLWAASCSDRLGSLAGDADELVELFEAQIPDFRDFTRGVRL